MMNMHSKYDNMHKNGMIYAVKCTNSHVISSINSMLSDFMFCLVHLERKGVSPVRDLVSVREYQSSGSLFLSKFISQQKNSCEV